MKSSYSKLGSLVAVAVVGAAGIFLGGCAAEVSERPIVVADQPAVIATAVPADIETYPHVYYRGSVAYYVGDRWYYRGPTGYVVFRHEPVELVRYRTAFRSRVRVY
jgi:hypothetical protein